VLEEQGLPSLTKVLKGQGQPSLTKVLEWARSAREVQGFTKSVGLLEGHS
jgi:hypothetical protein